ncbi:MAG TPA: S-methyl-5-thioribose-1-phosphate isomerase [Planctomycetaceae bacterium]|jgi:methylthioribose-1-phosphate isomerase|nr:S-methyl-5-thioribose-1-phosphate isomerase [Planctomycetaceae bacterium]
MTPPTLAWRGDAATGHLELLDQTLLPLDVQQRPCRQLEDVVESIKSLRVRGAPAIGVAAAYGVVIGLQSQRENSRDEFDRQLARVTATLADSRPTAINLNWALSRLADTAAADQSLQPGPLHDLLLEEARAIQDEDRHMCESIGQHGAGLLPEGSGVLTHCNAGGLATAGSGTALAVLFAAADQDRAIHVYVDETRPLLQGARLTTWELTRHGIPTTLICDSMAAWAMQQGRVQAVITGADRIAANGDAANKIGTYALAVLARQHQVPFYIAAPRSTFDFSIESGNEIPIEERAGTEITQGFGRQTAPDDVDTWNPAFDVTPAELITALITERGVIQPVNRTSIQQMLGNDGA